jgi:hypothetical protein
VLVAMISLIRLGAGCWPIDRQIRKAVSGHSPHPGHARHHLVVRPERVRRPAAVVMSRQGAGTVTTNGPAVPVSQAAACWLAAAGGYAFTANAGSGSIGRYAVAPSGTLTVLGSTLAENNTASHPLDEGVSADQHYLYVLADGVSQIVGYQVGSDGSLTQVTTTPVASPRADLSRTPTHPAGNREGRDALASRLSRPPGGAVGAGREQPGTLQDLAETR